MGALTIDTPSWLRIVGGRCEIATDDMSVFAFADLIRRTEEELLRLFSRGEIGGTIHTCLGQEICQLAVVRALGPEDFVLSNHRNHGHLLAFCGNVAGLLAEITGREGAINGGRGGSQHMAFAKFFSNGVQGGMAGIAAGLALASRMTNEASIVALMLGDGSLGEGLVYEAMNLAGIWSLPMLFVVEYNGIAQTTPTASTLSGDPIARGRAFGLHSWRVDDSASDFIDEVDGIVRFVREKRQPGFLLIETARLGPHSKGDDTRSKAEIGAIRARDPLMALRRRIGNADASEIEKVNASLVHAISQEVLSRGQVADVAQLTPLANVDTNVLVAENNQLTAREALNSALRRLLVEDERVVLLGEDLHDPYGGAFKVTAGLSTDFPDRVLSTPISEAGITGVSIGLALAGRRPVLEIMFADFLSLCMDQLYNHATKLGAVDRGKVAHVVVRSPSGGRRGYGPTHSQCPEALIAAIPGMTVVCPNHRLDAGRLLEAAVKSTIGPLLFVEHKLLYDRKLATDDYQLLLAAEWNGLDRLFPTLARLRPHPDLIVLTYGGILAEVEDAVRHLEEGEELSVEILVPSLLAPLPATGLVDRICRCDRLLVVEEGPRFFGLGAEMVARLVEANAITRVHRLGTEATIIPAARHLETKAIPGVAEIVSAAVSMFS